MKRTSRDPIRAGLFQRDIVLHDANNVRLAAQIINESLWKTHGVKAELSVVILGAEENRLV